MPIRLVPQIVNSRGGAALFNQSLNNIPNRAGLPPHNIHWSDIVSGLCGTNGRLNGILNIQEVTLGQAASVNSRSLPCQQLANDERDKFAISLFARAKDMPIAQNYVLASSFFGPYRNQTLTKKLGGPMKAGRLQTRPLGQHLV